MDPAHRNQDPMPSAFIALGTDVPERHVLEPELGLAMDDAPQPGKMPVAPMQKH
jgi:hypothetical protein